jgi:hypothetical protein
MKALTQFEGSVVKMLPTSFVKKKAAVTGSLYS